MDAGSSTVHADPPYEKRERVQRLLRSLEVEPGAQRVVIPFGHRNPALEAHGDRPDLGLQRTPAQTGAGTITC
jgi:hypothetical protein